MVRVTGFEPAASWSQTTRATSCATPGCRQKKLAPFRFRLAAKTAHALLPSSSPNRTRCAGLRFGKQGRRKLAPFRFRLSAKTAHALLPSSSPNRTHCVGLRFGKLGRRNSLRSVSHRQNQKSAFFKAYLLYITARGEARDFSRSGESKAFRSRFYH